MDFAVPVVVCAVQAQARSAAVAGGVAWDLSETFKDDAGEGGEAAQSIKCGHDWGIADRRVQRVRDKKSGTMTRIGTTRRAVEIGVIVTVCSFVSFIILQHIPFLSRVAFLPFIVGAIMWSVFCIWSMWAAASRTSTVRRVVFTAFHILFTSLGAFSEYRLGGWLLNGFK